jgi:hypothetical protein
MDQRDLAVALTLVRFNTQRARWHCSYLPGAFPAPKRNRPMELPGLVSAEVVTMAVLASGVVTSARCVCILTAAEAVAAMDLAGAAGYKPPSS